MVRSALSPAEVDEVWERWRSGQAVKVLSRQMRRHPSTVRDLLKRCGGIRPRPRARGELRLSLAEREEISRGLAAGSSLRAIAAALGRAPSTVSREVTANGGRGGYRAVHADSLAWQRACRPKPTKLSRLPGLASMVDEKLAARWSPEQIAGRLRRRFGEAAKMNVSHETSYRSLFVQSRGDLRHELTKELRSRRAMRRPGGQRLPDGRGNRLHELTISDRPAEVADRAVPGHWEGDLVFGRGMSPIATLVERSTRFAILVALPDGHRSQYVVAALARTIKTLPKQLARSLTWDQGNEMSMREVHDRHRCRCLLLRPEERLAARQQREHERSAAPVPAADSGLPHPQPGRPRRHRRRAQRPTSTDPRTQTPSEALNKVLR